MQSEQPVRQGSEEVSPSAEPLPQPAAAVPLDQTIPNALRRRRNTRAVAQRRRQQLQELLQRQAPGPANP